MLHDESTAIAFRCPNCSELVYESITIFSFGGQQRVQIQCNCQYIVAVVGYDKNKEFYLRLNCLFCSTHHFFFYSYQEFWSKGVMKIKCPQSGITRGYIGPASLLKDRVPKDEGLSLLLGQMNFDHYFHDPEAMLDVLEIIHDIAQAGRLYCQCGSDAIDITMYPDKLELICKDCKGLVMINGSSKENLPSLRRMRSLLLPESQGEICNPEGSFY